MNSETEEMGDDDHPVYPFWFNKNSQPHDFDYDCPICGDDSGPSCPCLRE